MNQQSAIASVRASRRLASLIVLAMVVAMTGRAYADEELPKPADESAKAHFDSGNTAFRSAQARTDPSVQRTEYEGAIKEYLAGLSTETKFHYSFYWNLGHAYRQLGEYTRADYFYKKFLEFAPARFALHRTAADDFRRMMRAELDKAATFAEPTAPAPAPLHDPKQASTPAAEERRSSFTGRRKGAVALWAIGAVGVGGGIALELSSRSIYDDAESATDNTSRHELTDSANTRRGVAIAASAVGVVAIGTGVYLWVSGSAAERRAVSVAPLIGADNARVVVMGRF